MMRLTKSLLRAAAAILLAATISACNDEASNRIPTMLVRIEFKTVGDWTTYGVHGATDHVTFTLSPRQPANFPYTALSGTGFGGVILVGDILGQPRAYDLSCPVEARRDVLVSINPATNKAVCAKCGSVYEIFELGNAISGEAAQYGYSLRPYAVSLNGSGGVYASITN